jgi:hypothetical protein
MAESYATQYGKLVAENERLRQRSQREYEAWKEMKERKIQQLEEARKELKND